MLEKFTMANCSDATLIKSKEKKEKQVVLDG